MRVLILTFLILFQGPSEVAKRIYAPLLKENIQLKTYVVSKSYKLNVDEYILIGKDSIQNVENEGYRMLYLAKDSSLETFSKKYISKPKGEAYVYNPYFFEFSDGEKLIVAEEGYEYMSGIDIYRLSNSKIDFLGYVPVSGPYRDSVIEQIKIEKSSSGYKISFTGQIEYETASDNIIDGSTLSVSIIDDELKIKVN